MKVLTGLFDKCVLQRGTAGRSDTVVTGKCDTDGNVFARITQKGSPVRGFANKRIGQAKRGKFEGRLKGLPAGGPYDVTLAIDKAESVTVKNVLVGDVWVLAGQSNMQGCGLLADADTPDRHVRAFYMNDEWDTAEDPIHNIVDAVAPVHNGRADGKRTPREKLAQLTGVGPGVTFGKEMYKATGVPQGLIACAHGGTSMEQWDPAKKKLGGKSLYGAMVRRFGKNGSRVAGVLWYQGCSDSSPKQASVYTKRMKKLIASMRRDFGDAKLPVVIAQISHFVFEGEGASWSDIQEQQYHLPKAIDRLLTVPTIDLPLSDGIHLSGTGQQVLGRRLAQAMRVLRGDRSAGKPPIALKSIAVTKNPSTQLGDLTVTFDNVMGELCSPGRPTGFTIANPAATPAIYDVALDGCCAILRTCVPMDTLKGWLLYYAHGLEPYVNITDSAGRSLPALGPVAIDRPKLCTPFFKELRVSRPQLLTNDIAALKYPTEKERATLELRREESPPGGLFNMNEIFKRQPGESVIYFVCDYRCAEPMLLELGMGYDGPVKVWCDGEEIFCDQAGTNPANVDKARIDLPKAKGIHELMIALASNGGNAWGVRLRMFRTDTIRKKAGRNTVYRVPSVLG